MFAQVSGSVIWIPSIISLAGVLVVIIINVFFFGEKMGKKADKEDVDKKLSLKVDTEVYREDKKQLNDILKNKADQRIFDIFMKTTNDSYEAIGERINEIDEKQDIANETNSEVYRKISVSLAEINSFMKNMKDNCDREICKNHNSK